MSSAGDSCKSGTPPFTKDATGQVQRYDQGMAKRGPSEQAAFAVLNPRIGLGQEQAVLYTHALHTVRQAHLWTSTSTLLRPIVLLAQGATSQVQSGRGL